MLKCFFKSFAVVTIVSILYSCSNQNNKPIIKFSGDSASIIVKNIDEASLLQVKNRYQINADSINLITVLLRPGELDSLQDEVVVPGKITVQGDSVVFMPEQPFEKNKSYLIENYIGIKFAGLTNLLNGTAKHNLQPQKQILKR